MAVLAAALGACQRSDVDLLESPSALSVVATTDYPAVVKVVLPGGYGVCTGTFVSPRAVLTAAHCVADSGTYTVFASFGRFQTTRVESLGPGTVEDRNDIAFLIFDYDIASREY